MNPIRPLALALALSVLCLGHAAAQPVPADWPSLTERTGQCQIQVPPDWKLKPGVLPSAQSPGGDEQVQLEPVLTKLHVDYAKRREHLMTAWSHNPGFTVLQSDAARTVLRFRNGTLVQWAVVVAGPVVCEASLSARNASDALVPRIAGSLRASHS